MMLLDLIGLTRGGPTFDLVVTSLLDGKYPNGACPPYNMQMGLNML
jgi:hypothetical protein